ncbi:MAG: DUF3108 domain-containing protein [Cytophagales bacterium]|nr:DUF3108 domain-containing protein [Cytophagales bacterium]
MLALMLYDKWELNMKNMLTFILIIGSWFSEAQPTRLLNEKPVNLGEKLEFKLSYGWFTVGRASWTTDKNHHVYGGEECYKLQVKANSTGFLGSFAKVDDEWGEYMRTDDFMPMMAYRDLEEGKYTLDEQTYFDYDAKNIRYERIRKGIEKPIEHIGMDKARLGMLGGFMQMRSVDYRKYESGDRIKIDAFFEGENYEMEIIYKGIVELKSKVGRLRAYKIIPVLPENRLFPGEFPIAAWFSADRNRLPLRVDAKMSFGTTYVELTNYENVRYGPDYQ